ncbi:hypothetical protein ACFZBE_29850 [Streptomyces sp. NPDC008061]|uniref:hypothetical protein n=1 Tax=Streptomyces sp. NPDC008061 TaxID=3364805 RepID=UPI0036E0E73C
MDSRSSSKSDGTGSPVSCQGFELDVIAAVVILGPLTGGLGRIIGTVVGALIISMLSNGLVLIGLGFPRRRTRWAPNAHCDGSSSA